MDAINQNPHAEHVENGRKQAESAKSHEFKEAFLESGGLRLKNIFFIREKSKDDGNDDGNRICDQIIHVQHRIAEEEHSNIDGCRKSAKNQIADDFFKFSI